MIYIVEGGARREDGSFLPEGYYEVSKEKRTSNQNRALHKWFALIAENSNELGLTLDLLYNQPQNMRITPDLLKNLFREYGRVMYNKDSTSKLTKDEMSKLITVFEQLLAERLNNIIPFPHYE
jgi:hypothetical protein